MNGLNGHPRRKRAKKSIHRKNGVMWKDEMVSQSERKAREKNERNEKETGEEDIGGESTVC